MTPNNWQARLAQQLADRREQHLLRSRRTVTPLSATHVQFDNRRLVNFASNDYLGFTHHPRVIEAVTSSARTHGAGAGASALICGHTDLHEKAEKKIADWKSTEAAVLLPSGYQANHAAVQTLTAMGAQHPGGVRFLLDKLVHASLIDAVRGSECLYRVFPHNHLEKLSRLLEESPKDQLQVVVTESIFSMDGDHADLSGIAELRRKFGFVLLLDEAHASGAFGPAGAGLAAAMGLRDSVDVSVVTLGKALGCAGGAVCGSTLFCSALVNFGRAHIYTTQFPATSAAGICAAIELLQSEPVHQGRLSQNVKRARVALGRHFQIPAGDSPIIPIVLGDEARAVAVSEKLLQAGFFVTSVRPPTVPKGTSRLRVTLSAGHTEQEIDQLIQAIVELAK